MDDTINKLKISWKQVAALYDFALFIIVISTVLAPTNLAGPGMDMLVIFITVVANIFFLFRSVFKLIGGDKPYKQVVVVHGIVFFL